MDYYETINEINKRIELIIEDKITLLAFAIRTGILLEFINTHVDKDKIYDEVAEYVLDYIADTELEHILLENMLKYLNNVKEEEYYESNEIYLYDGLIRIFNNSCITRRNDYSRIINQYNMLLINNAITKNTYKIIRGKKYLSYNDYQKIMEVVLK